MNRRERIMTLLNNEDGLTDREITDRVDGVDEPQQAVNQICRQLATKGILFRKVREDGLLGNYLGRKSDSVYDESTSPIYREENDQLSKLLCLGFKKAGDWLLKDENLQFDLREYQDETNIIYAFTINGKIMYIGKSVQSLKTRVNLYKNAGESQKTNLRVNANLIDELLKGKSISIYALVFEVPFYYADIQIDLAAGLEDGLIKKFDPDWNVRK